MSIRSATAPHHSSSRYLTFPGICIFLTDDELKIKFPKVVISESSANFNESIFVY